MNEPKRYTTDFILDYDDRQPDTEWVSIDDPAYQDVLDRSRRFTESLDAVWQIVYPGKTDWEYPAQVVRHVRDAYQETQRKAEAFDMLEELIRVVGRLTIYPFAEDTVMLDYAGSSQPDETVGLEAAIRAAHAALKEEK